MKNWTAQNNDMERRIQNNDSFRKKAEVSTGTAFKRPEKKGFPIFSEPHIFFAQILEYNFELGPEKFWAILVF